MRFHSVHMVWYRTRYRTWIQFCSTKISQFLRRTRTSAALKIVREPLAVCSITSYTEYKRRGVGGEPTSNDATRRCVRGAREINEIEISHRPLSQCFSRPSCVHSHVQHAPWPTFGAKILLAKKVRASLQSKSSKRLRTQQLSPGRA